MFAELCGSCMHRIDIDCVMNPDKPFNNFGGNNFWPAPEGGAFGFNYEGDTWRVQEAINNQPFELLSANKRGATMEKTVSLTNRTGTTIEAVMRRQVELVDFVPSALSQSEPLGIISYRAIDSFQVLNDVPVESGLIAAWTLEQFDASEHTRAFCVVDNPDEAINFDFYNHPGERINCFPKGFTYRTDGRCAGQIGVKVGAKASCVGAVDSARGTICIRENLGPSDGVFFNIADNDQLEGPYSAADNYSVFNSDPEMSAYELETIGSAKTANGLLKGSELMSVTCFAIFADPAQAVSLVDGLLL